MVKASSQHSKSHEFESPELQKKKHKFLYFMKTYFKLYILVSTHILKSDVFKFLKHYKILYKNDQMKSCVFKTEKIIKMQRFMKSCVFATVENFHFHII